MPTMPNGLKVVVTQGYAITAPGGTKRTEVGGGMPRYALDWDRGTQQFSVTLILDALQWQVWESFWLIAIKKGSLPFDMTLDSGLGPALHTVHILPGTHSVNKSLGIFATVSFTVEAESQVYANPDAGTSIIDLYNTYGSGTAELLEAIAYLANVSSTNALDF